MRKKCTKCQEFKSVYLFPTNNRMVDGRDSWCNKCHDEATKLWRANNKSKDSTRHRNYLLNKKYGISSKEYESLFEKQGGRCAICRTDRCKTKRKLAVDHDHASGRIRGLLCANCNQLLGKSMDNIDILNNAIEYLKQEIK